MQSILAHDHAENGASTIAPAGPSSMHTMLRESTRAQHDVLDEAFSRFDLADAQSYRRFLLAHRQALVVLIERCSTDDRRELAPLVTLLEADLGLAALHFAPGLELPRPNQASEVGVAYVLRGSRLGAAYLRRRVGVDLPASYLRHELATPWPAFLARMESTVPPTSHATRAVVDAARMAFSVFARSADAQAPVTGWTRLSFGNITS